jgi:hypothetical protein
MTPTVRSSTELLVAGPAAVVHGGTTIASAVLLPAREGGPLDGALRVQEDGRVVPGLCLHLHAFGCLALDLGRLAPGRHVLTAAYTGGTHYAPALSAAFEVLVLPASTVTGVVVPPGGVRGGDRLGVTVLVPDSSAPAYGEVRLHDGARLLATGTVVEGAGTVAVPDGLAPGMHRMFVAYAGSRTHRPSETPLLPVRVR